MRGKTNPAVSFAGCYARYRLRRPVDAKPFVLFGQHGRPKPLDPPVSGHKCHHTIDDDDDCMARCVFRNVVPAPTTAARFAAPSKGSFTAGPKRNPVRAKILPRAAGAGQPDTAGQRRAQRKTEDMTVDTDRPVVGKRRRMAAMSRPPQRKPRW